MRLINLVLTLLILNLTSSFGLNGLNEKPLALGLGGGEKYVLFENGELFKLGSKGDLEKICRIKLPYYVYDSWIEFQVEEDLLYLYSYKAIGLRGSFFINLFNLTSSEELSELTFKFESKKGYVEGFLVLATSAQKEYLAVLGVNGTQTKMLIYRFNGTVIEKLNEFDGRLSLAAYGFNETFYLPMVINNSVFIVDVIKDRIMYSLPSLTPVIALSYPLLQLFYLNNSWIIYVTVVLPTAQTIDTYVVYPNSFTLNEGPLASVDPLQRYCVIQPRHRNATTIIFPDNETIPTNYLLRCIPMGNWFSADPYQGVLDVDLAKHRALIKIVSGNESQIILIDGNSEKKIYSLPIEGSFRRKGFYATIVEDSIYVIDPRENRLIKINVKEENIFMKHFSTWISLVLISALTLTLIAYWKRKRKSP